MPLQFDNSTSTGKITWITSGTWAYSWPTTAGTSGQYLGTDGVSGFQWVSATPTGIAYSVDTSSPNNTVNYVSINAADGTTNQSIAIIPKGTGGISLRVPDSTATGGNVRGAYSLDFGYYGSNANQVTAGSYDIILGGGGNGTGTTTAGTQNMIIGGISNAIQTNNYNKILGGQSNVIKDCDYNTIMGGYSCEVARGAGNAGATQNTLFPASYITTAGRGHSIWWGNDSFALYGATYNASYTCMQTYDSYGTGVATIAITGDEGTSPVTETSVNVALTPNSVIHGRGYFVMSDANSPYTNCRVWRISFCCKRTGAGNVTAVGTGTVTAIASTTYSMNVNIVLNTTNQTVTFVTSAGPGVGITVRIGGGVYYTVCAI